MRMVMKALLAGGIAVAITVSVSGQVHRVPSPGTVRTVTDDDNRTRH